MSLPATRFEIIVVNRENFFLFTPMLHEIAASDLDLTDIVNPIPKMIRHIDFLCGDVDKIEIENKRVTLVKNSVATPTRNCELARSRFIPGVKSPPFSLMKSN